MIRTLFTTFITAFVGFAPELLQRVLSYVALSILDALQAALCRCMCVCILTVSFRVCVFFYCLCTTSFSSLYVLSLYRRSEELRDCSETMLNYEWWNRVKQILTKPSWWGVDSICVANGTSLLRSRRKAGKTFQCLLDDVRLSTIAHSRAHTKRMQPSPT